MADGRGSFFGRVPHPRYVMFLLVMAAAVWPLRAMTGWVGTVVAAFDVAVIVFVISCSPLWRNGDANIIRTQAVRDDAGQALLLVLTAVITSVVLAALGTLVLESNNLAMGEIALLVVTLLASWTFANLIYAFHYARLYYSIAEGTDYKGLDFPGEAPPDFADFVNFAFVIGMTCQTADVDITDKQMRRVSTFHGLFAFAFNLGILALTINVLASATGRH